jgi:hypothetical protein
MATSFDNGQRLLFHRRRRRDLEGASRAIGGAVRCSRCGLTLGEAAIRRDLALVLAACCPRCDGPLEHADSTASGDPAIYLG